MTASENITRAEAKERSALVETRAYEVVLDVTSDGPTFSTVTTVTFGCRQPGASTWIDLIAPTVHSVVLNGVDLDVSAVVDGPRITLPDLQADNLLVVTADGAFMNTGEGLHRFIDPVDKETYLYTQFESADSRRMYASFEQPDLKATFGLTVTAPSHWQVVSNSPTPEPDNHGDGTATWAFEPTPRISTYITALVAGPYHRVTDSYTGTYGTYPLDVYCRESLAQYLDSDEILTVTKQGFAYFEEQFGVAVPVREVRPAVRAGVQRRRDGERRLRDDPRGLRLPLARDGRRLRAARQHDPARARAHVVRRPRHDDLVGRPVAQRVLRRVGRALVQRQRHPLHRRLDDVRQPAQGLGLPPGPAARRRTRSRPTWSTSTRCA